MGALDLAITAAVGLMWLAGATALWALALRRRLNARVAALERRLKAAEGQADAAFASAEAFDSALISIEAGEADLASGEETLAACAEALGVEAAPTAVIHALMRADPDHGRRLQALFDQGEPCAFEARGPKGVVSVEGRAAGAFAWLRLSSVQSQDGLPGAARFAALLDAAAHPAWIARSDGTLVWANHRWLEAAGAADIDEARTRGLAFDKAAETLAAEAASLGQRRELLRWSTIDGRRRAFNIVAAPLEGGDVGVHAQDVTEAEETKEALRRHDAAHDETLNHLADAVAIFDAGKRLSFHNTAFAQLWGLEPAWLAERPTHAELLDRLRQRRRLPETADYAKWKAGELSHYESVQAAPDELWTLPDGRTLRVVRQPHPMGGLLLLFSDITGELRTKAQYNALVQVQQATLDKLTDAVAVFASDGRLRLHNEAFERFWGVTKAQLEDAGDFDGVAELGVRRLHDMAFWRELKARVADIDPRSRQPQTGEARTGDDRIVAWQSRPLPDGATLIGFADVTDTRRLEKALADRSAALTEAERLKRDFVGNVSYELRTPLTTIIGYSELLDHAGEALPERARGHVAAVRAAATQLAHSIDDVLDMAQIDAGEMALDLGDAPVEEILQQTVERMAREAAEADVKLELVCEDGVGVIRADPKRLGQSLDHLVDNAIRQSPKGGVVTIAARKAASEIQIQITDRGRGIPFHVQAHIFDRFVGRDRGGPGLGLALVKALIELHGGWVALESEPGAGATFTCHLPEVAYAEGAGQAELF
jgi:signal transduction histidine kinase